MGCPIWSYKGWMGSFFPEGTKQSDFLREYARRLTTVEGNTTFYAVPNEEKLARWIDETPETFRFCPKVPRTISHAGELQPHIDEAHAFIQVMSRLGSRLGPMFLQLPPRFAPDQLSDLEAFLKAWPAQVRLAVEVRHSAWFIPAYQEKLLGMLQSFNKTPVLVDTRPIRSLRGKEILKGSVYKELLEIRERKQVNPIPTHSEGPFTFLRFIGHPMMEQNAEFIDSWANYLAGALDRGHDVFVFCHCPDVRQDPLLCREFHQRVRTRIDIPPLPWEVIDANLPSQSRLL